MTLDQAIERIQFCYPQVYYACHTRHVRARSTAAHLSMRDSEIYNPIFRVLSKVVFSPYATIDTYQADLRKRLATTTDD